MSLHPYFLSCDECKIRKRNVLIAPSSYNLYHPTSLILPIPSHTYSLHILHYSHPTNIAHKYIQHILCTSEHIKRTKIVYRILILIHYSIASIKSFTYTPPNVPQIVTIQYNTYITRSNRLRIQPQLTYYTLSFARQINHSNLL